MCDKFEATLGSVFNFNEVRRLMSSEHVGSVSRSFGLLLLMEWMLAYKVSID
jgi:hypothetical protein